MQTRVGVGKMRGGGREEMESTAILLLIEILRGQS